MPPIPLEFQGRELSRRLLTAFFRQGRRRHRLVATRANGQPAFGIYVRDPHAPIAHASGLIVLTLTSDLISGITRFDTSVLPSFGLPRSLRD
jgi:RNA polymerase sigma-70 factor (ECF subfamily)